jgi:hypothetical protein
MADEQPEQVGDESKKDTVRINLPPGLIGRGAPTPPSTKTKPITPVPAPEDEAKKETAVMGKPVTAPKPKSDTSRVQVPGAKPTVPETPRPTVKLRREVEAPVAAPAAPAAAPLQPVMAPAAAPSGADAVLAVGAMVLSIAVLVYLAMLSMG